LRNAYKKTFLTQKIRIINVDFGTFAFKSFTGRSMKYTIDKKENYTIITIDEKKLDTSIAPDLKSEFVKLNAEGITNLILDLNNVKYTDSSGLSSILIANRLCNSSNGLLILTSLQDHVMKLISISKLESVLNILPTVEEAIDRVFLHEIEQDLTNKED
jgi:anti-sigma B factor antagonist